MKSEIQECTFKPNTNKSRNASASKSPGPSKPNSSVLATGKF